MKYSTLALLFGLTTAKKMDVPKEYEWVNKCDWETDYSRYAAFPAMEKEVDCRDACLLVHFSMLATADLDHSLSLDRCEWSYACIAMSHEEGDGEEEGIAKGKACAKAATKHIDAKKGVTPKDIAMDCATQYKNTYCPAIDGTPWAEEATSMYAVCEAEIANFNYNTWVPRGTWKSGNGKNVHVTFDNTSPVHVKIEWLNYQGGKNLYKVLAPHTSYVQQTFSSHVWVLSSVTGGAWTEQSWVRI